MSSLFVWMIACWAHLFRGHDDYEDDSGGGGGGSDDDDDDEFLQTFVYSSSHLFLA